MRKLGWATALVASASLVVLSCSRSLLEDFDDAVADSGTSCDGPACSSTTCRTTVSGVAYVPNARDPIGGAAVYFPEGVLPPLGVGPSCEPCSALAGATAVAVTAPDGKFVLELPPGAPPSELVLQIGKWRRKVTLPPLATCADTPLDPELTRLPRTHGEGDMPLFAITTGTCDRFECVLRMIGVDDREFTVPSGDGRVHLYQVNGGTIPGIPSADVLLGDPARLGQYDAVLFDCSGNDLEKPLAQKQNVVDYTTAGGRLFVSHYGYVWLYDMAPFAATATWEPHEIVPRFDRMPAKLDTSHPRGAAFEQWMKSIGAILHDSDSTIDILDPPFDVRGLNPPALAFLSTDYLGSVQAFTFDTPLDAPPPQRCGRVAFTDFHGTGPQCVAEDPTFPTECEAPTTAVPQQERATEFMLFDLVGCVQGYQPTAPAPRAPDQAE